MNPLKEKRPLMDILISTADGLPEYNRTAKIYTITNVLILREGIRFP
jgi:hypothetical protein